MGRYKKCIICEQPIIDEQGVPYKGRFVHQICFNKTINLLQYDKKKQLEEVVKKKNTTKKIKPQAELKEGLSEEEYKKKKNYYTYLRQITSQDMTAKIYSLTEDYIKRYGFTYENMHSTLIYLNEILNRNLTGDIVGLIPYYYNEAQAFYNLLNQINEANKDIDTTQMYKRKTIIAKPKHKINKQLDIEGIGGED